MAHIKKTLSLSKHNAVCHGLAVMLKGLFNNLYYGNENSNNQGSEYSGSRI